MEHSFQDLLVLVAETRGKVISAARDLEVLTKELRRRLDEEGDELLDDDEPDVQ